MKIVYLAAGAAGMYCGSCLHDNTLAAALQSRGEDILLIPTYTPLRTDEATVSDERLFFGGINVYLQQKSAFFRHTPWFLDALLDHPTIMRWVTHGGPSVEAENLGDLTVSMLAGEHGHQRKELQKLVHWLAQEPDVDVVHLSNAMLMGMAREIRKLGLPVVCSLSGEDIFLEKLTEPSHGLARAELRERAREIDAFVALNHYYADYMADYLAVPRERIRVVPHGLNLTGHGTRKLRDEGPLVVGYLARICPDKGLHNLIAAAELLQRDPSVPPFRVRAAGYLSKLDRPYLETIEKQVSGWPAPKSFEYAGELSRQEKIEFLQELDMMVLPTDYHESKGLSVLEAMANAVPVVLPEHGTFPEMIAQTGGGVLYPPAQPTALAEAIKQLMLDPARRIELGSQGQQAVRRDFHADAMADHTLDLYRQVTSRKPG